MPVADEFRAKARTCFERSKRAPDIDYQQLFRDLAVQWLALAAEAGPSLILWLFFFSPKLSELGAITIGAVLIQFRDQL